MDTNILVAYIRGQGLGRWIEQRYQLQTTARVPLLSVVSQGEIRSLTLQFGWGSNKMRQLHELLGRFVSVPLEFDRIIESYAEIDHYSRGIGRKMSKNDLWIAATAHVTRAVLLTTDRDFDHLDPRFLTRDWVDPANRL